MGKSIRKVFLILFVMLLFLGIGFLALLSSPLPSHTAASIAPEVHYVDTEDGWQVALSHYAPCWRGPCLEGGPSVEKAPPVLMCHGLSSNRFAFDLTEGRSMARYLADRGHDVWLVELRGHGLSRRQAGADGGGEAFVSLDDFIMEDMPATIEFVQQKTQATQVHWVGHSMGGMILYGYLATHSNDVFASATAMSSPGKFYADADPLLGFFMGQLDILSSMPMMPAAFGGQLLSRITGRPPGTGFSWELDNIEESAVKQYLAYGLAPVYPGEMKGMLSVIREGGLVSVDGKTRYVDNYGKIVAPFLFLTGTKDKLGPPRSLRGVFDAVGSEEKTFVEVGIEGGFSADYGHGDILLGDKAELEVFPIVLNWLNAHSGLDVPDGALLE